METKPLIFVVEDDAVFNKMISNFLELKNMGEIQSFHSGEECMDKISLFNFKPDIILLDYGLPNRNGIEVMEFVKKIYPEISIIFLSGQSDTHIVVDALQKGAFDYITKDKHTKENVLNKIDQILRIKKLEKDKKSFKSSTKIVVGALVGAWIILLLLYFIFVK
jgi:DNA-binding NtrC family response regulator